MIEKNMGFGVRKTWVQIPALPFTRCKLGQIEICVLFPHLSKYKWNQPTLLGCCED